MTLGLMEKSAGWSEMSECSGAEREIHENGAETKEVDGAKGLGEEVSDVVGGTYVRDGNGAVLDELANPQVASVDVLRAIVVLGVVGEVRGQPCCQWPARWGRRVGNQAR